MASSYALPVSAMTHGHNHAHGHLHSHSHSPGRQYSANTPRSLKSERSNGSLHSHSLSESHLEHEHTHSHRHNHSHERDHSPSPYLPTPPSSTDLPPLATFDKQYESSAQLNSYEPPPNAVEAVSHNHNHSHHGHSHSQHAPVEPRSRFTNFLLPFVLRWPLVHTILAAKDSRRIFYFMSLNFAFMVVQACYGYLTDSLGLLSDSIHMFFDCLALGVGLFAAVASKWPPSQRFPYGFGKIESLSGFGNGVFLMLISVEIMIEATERLADGRETKRLLELFIVSGLGLAVNLVGMACFGHHGHAGHDHGGHSHNHGHSHSHEKEHSHEGHDHHHEEKCNGQDHGHGHGHSHSHSNSHSHDGPLLADSPPPKAHAHSHSHDNENMHGIFLHVLADTMGSAAVMVSTALIYLTSFSGWDPIASCIIAILIFMSSIPLIKSSARKLLLTIPDETEYLLRDTLSGVSDIRGVASYTVPRFWVDDGVGSEGEKVLGVMHVVATRGSELDEVRERIREFLVGRGVDVVVQVEKDGETGCWCGGAGSKPPSLY